MKDPSSRHAYTIGAYMRVASIAVALYDYLETYPTAYRFYKEQWRSRRVSLSAVLFVLIRSVSISVLLLSSVGFFYGDFTQETCEKFYLLPPAFKVLQAMVSQAILGVRTYNLSQRSRLIGGLLIAIYIVSCTLQWVTTLIQRKPLLNHEFGRGNCRAFSEVVRLGAWIYYAIAIIYDVIVTTMSVLYLLKYKLTTTNSMVSKITKMMLYDGLGYLFALTAVNILNLILYKSSQDIQNAAASLGYCVSWIMSQRILIHLYDASRQRRDNSIVAPATNDRNSFSDPEMRPTFMSQSEQKSAMTFPFSIPTSIPHASQRSNPP